MRVAVISDVHGNLHALEAVLAAIDIEAPDEIWCLGDVVGYGPRPNECCSLVRERARLSLCGNHDLGVIGTIDLEEFSLEAALAAMWTRGVLTAESRTFLEGLDAKAKAPGVALYHGSARDPVWEYVLTDEAAQATLALTEEPVVLVGHSHAALQIELRDGKVAGGLAPGGTIIGLAGARWVLNPGSVGQPRDGDPRAAYALLDLDAQEVSYRRVDYDIALTQQEMREAGLPEPLATRLEDGQ